jgi:hypothetical protein
MPAHDNRKLASSCDVRRNPLSQTNSSQPFFGRCPALMRKRSLFPCSLFAWWGAGLYLVLLACLPAAAGDAGIAQTPPMGWNSWDSYGRTVSEAQFKANSRWMAKHLKRFGWQYVVIDEG